MEIKPKVGIDHVRLGMNMTEVRALYGQPKSISNFIALEDRPEDRSVTWEYVNGIEFSFDSDDNFVIGSITTRANDSTLEGITFIGKTFSKLLIKYPNIKLDDDFGENGKDYVLDKKGLSFWVIDDIVDSITIFPEYDEAGNEAIWPT